MNQYAINLSNANVWLFKLITKPNSVVERDCERPGNKCSMTKTNIFFDEFYYVGIIY